MLGHGSCNDNKTRSRFLILTGDGINCANETAWAFELAGGQADIVHINDLLETPERLLDFDGMAFPGGFSFGDDLGSGQVMALKMRHALGTELQSLCGKGIADHWYVQWFSNADQVGTIAPSNTRTFSGTGAQSTRSVHRSMGDPGKTEQLCL